MKSIKILTVLIMVGMCSSSSNLTPHLSKNIWGMVASHLNPKHDKKLSMAHANLNQNVKKISAYESIKARVCPDNRDPWDFIKNLHSGEVIIEDDSELLPSMDALVHVINDDYYTNSLDWLSKHKMQMTDFLRCQAQITDLSNLFGTIIQNRLIYHNQYYGWRKVSRLINSFLDAGIEVNDEIKKVLEQKFVDLVQYEPSASFALFQTLLRTGINLNKKDENGWTALHWLVHHDELEKTRSLIEAGIDKHATNDNGQSVVEIAGVCQFAVVENDLAGMRERKADQNKQNMKGETALHWAVRLDNMKMLKTLIEQNVKKDLRNNRGETALFQAAERGNVEVARILIAAGANLEIINEEGHTALYVAVWHNHLEMIELLVEEDADMDQEAGVIHVAARLGHVEAAKILIEAGADFEKADADGRTPLHEAVGHTWREFVEMLLENGHDAEVKDHHRRTPLHLAEDLEIAELLIQNGANVKEMDYDRTTPLHSAAARNELEITKLLIKNGANVKEKDSEGNTALHHVALYTGCRSTKKLINFLEENDGFSKNLKNREGKTALHLASQANNVDTAEILIAHGENVEIKDNDGCTALHLAAKSNGHSSILLELLTAKGANLEAKNNDENTAIHFAAATRGSFYKNKAEFLIEKNVNLKAKNKKGDTAIHIVAKHDNFELLQKLIQTDVEINAQNKKGNTAIHIAVKHRNERMTQLLVDQGANKETENKEGHTAVSLAVDLGEREIIRILVANEASDFGPFGKDGGLSLAVLMRDIQLVQKLLENEIDLNSKDKKGRTALYLAVVWKELEIVNCLIEAGADTNARTNKGWTPLHEAASSGGLEAARMLLDGGAEKDAKTNIGKTPLHVATNNDNESGMVKLLIEKGADANVKNLRGKMPLHAAVERNSLEKIQLLVKAGAEVEGKDIFGRTAILFIATKVNSESDDAQSDVRFEIFKELVAEGATMNAKDNYGISLLHLACLFGEVKIIASLLEEEGVEVDAKTFWGETPMHLAASRNDFRAVEMLIGKNADVEAKNYEGNTALHLAVQGIEHYYYPYYCHCGNCCYHGCHCGNKGSTSKVLAALIEKGADLNAKNGKGETPLHLAATQGGKETVKMLVEKGADLEARNENGTRACDLLNEEREKEERENEGKKNKKEKIKRKQRKRKAVKATETRETTLKPSGAIAPQKKYLNLKFIWILVLISISSMVFFLALKN